MPGRQLNNKIQGVLKMKYNENNLLLKADSYKYCMYDIYPQGATSLFSYLESRGGDYDHTVFFGLQYYLKKYLSTPITMSDVEESKLFTEQHGVDFNYDGWSYIAQELCGKLPIRIRAVPEGLNVPVSNVLVSVESTDEKCFWLVNWIETLLLKVWYPTTVLTQNSNLRNIMLDALTKSSDDPQSEIEFKIHSFGYRGVASEESAGIGASAELLCSMGTDTLAGIILANNYYNSGMCGFSINASEHSVITSFSRENEIDAYRNMIKKLGKPGKLFACVCDSYNIYEAIKMWGTTLKQELKDSGTTLVIRPDSMEPTVIVPECLALMEKYWGCTINSKGYKVINDVKLIHGDGINPKSIPKILEAVMNAGYSISNIALGMGGASLTGTKDNVINRDTQKFAFKASSIVVDGQRRDVFKDPIGSDGKKSKKGRLDLVMQDGAFKTVLLNDDEIQKENSLMNTVYENGELIKEYSFSEIRDLINK